MLVYGEGPKPCSAMLVGEAFGYHEQLHGRPFYVDPYGNLFKSGKSAVELTRYLERAHLQRSAMYLTNVCNFQPPQRNGKQLPPTREDIARELPRLIDELNAVKPRWIGAVGKVSAQLLTGRNDLQMEWCHGWAFSLSERLLKQCRGKWSKQCQVVPMYHPAAGLHSSQVARFVWIDIKQFADYVHGHAVPVQPRDEYPEPEYVEVGSEVVTGLRRVGLDTEGTVPDPFSVQLSGRDGSAVFIESGSKWMVHAQGVVECARKLIGHNWLHDLHVCRALGLDLDSVDWDHVEDTMLMAFALGTVPLGLKPLSRRISGAVQQTYTEVVAPAQHRMANGYIQRALAVTDWPEREPQLDWDWSSGKWKFSKGWQVPQYLRRLQTDMDKATDDDPVDVQQRVSNWPDDVQELIADKVGAMPVATLRDVPRTVAVRYACRDADLTLRNFPVLDRMIDEQGLRAAYRLDMDVIPIAAEMERNGMAVDVAMAEHVARQLRRENDIILRKFQHTAGHSINPNSGDQIAALLFGERKLTFDGDDRRELQPELSLELEPEQMTRSGKRGSTSDKVLEGLKLKYADRDDVLETVQLTLDYRARAKIVQFADKLQSMSRPCNGHRRIFTRIKPVTAATYRWASGDVKAGLINLQNIPIRNKSGQDLGRMVRSCFVAPSGTVLASADYGQIELRVLAALSQDDELLRAFKTGVDPHLLGASRAWRMDYKQMLTAYKKGDRKIADIRDSAKNLNFGIVFGITPRGLMAQMQLRGLTYTLDECADLIKTWTRTVFPGIGAYIDRVQSEGKMNGYVRSVAGHMRHCPGVWSDIPSIREEALRQLVNFTIQCTAAEILKAGLRDLWRRGKPALDRCRTLILMSVHDENLFQVPVGATDTAGVMIETYMQDPLLSPELDRVRIGAKVKFGSNWAELKGA